MTTATRRLAETATEFANAAPKVLSAIGLCSVCGESRCICDELCDVCDMRLEADGHCSWCRRFEEREGAR